MARGAVLGLDGASFYHGSAKIFENVSFLLDEARTALVGENGAGKSTLLKCLTGELELNGGQIVKSRGLRVGYVPQEIPAEYAALTVHEVMERALVRAGAEGEDWRIDILLDEIGMSAETAAGAYSALSGGWQRLVLVAAAALLEEPDLLILDEPTNHLDLANINVLERWLLETMKLPMLIVSHDREFLNRVTSRTLFLRADGMHTFKTPFSEAREALLHNDAFDARRRSLEEKEIKRLEEMAARYKIWGVKNSKFDKRRKATEKRIDRIEEEKTEVYSSRERRLELADGDIGAKVALRLEGLKVATPDGRLLINIDRLAVNVGDRIALLGANGAGKSTLLNVVAKAFQAADPHYDGKAAVRFNPSCRLTVFDQAMADLPLKRSPMDYITALHGVTEKEAVSALVKAGFPFIRLKDPINLLSHGERARLKFLRLKLERPNLYLLDEPTNHLDIEGQEDLEAQLETADVSCLFVSHDRYFTRTAANRFLEIRRGRLVEVEDPDAFFEAQG